MKVIATEILLAFHAQQYNRIFKIPSETGLVFLWCMTCGDKTWVLCDCICFLLLSGLPSLLDANETWPAPVRWLSTSCFAESLKSPSSHSLKESRSRLVSLLSVVSGIALESLFWELSLGFWTDLFAHFLSESEVSRAGLFSGNRAVVVLRKIKLELNNLLKLF